MSALFLLLGIAVGAYTVHRFYDMVMETMKRELGGTTTEESPDFASLVFYDTAHGDVLRGDVLQWHSGRTLRRATSTDVNPSLIAGIAANNASSGDVVGVVRHGWLFNFTDDVEFQGKSLVLDENGNYTTEVESLSPGEALVTLGSTPNGSPDLWVNVRYLSKKV